MTNLELVLNMLAETATTEISKNKKPKNFPENKKVAKEGGNVAGNARREIESKTGKKVITPKNAKSLKLLIQSVYMNLKDLRRVRVSCILPVYNNSETLKTTINTILSSKLIDEVIVVDDCSKDNSAQIIKGFGKRIKYIQNNVNLGKGGAFVAGFKLSKGNLILTCDADNRNLKRSHLENIIKEYLKGKHQMILGARESDKGWGSLMAKITGERIFERKSLDKYLDLIEKYRYGMEQIINHAHKGKKVKVVVSKSIGHILKYKRHNIPEWLLDYVFQIRQILKTYWVLRKY